MNIIKTVVLVAFMLLGPVVQAQEFFGGNFMLKDALDALLAGEPIDPAQTKAVGCSIKFR